MSNTAPNEAKETPRTPGGAAPEPSKAGKLMGALELYQERVARYAAEAEALGRKSAFFSNLRGLSFGALVVTGIAAFAADDGRPWAVAAVVASAFFAVFVVRHGRVIAAELTALSFERVNRDALARSTATWRDLPRDGAGFVDAEHAYASDLDVFGKGSLFQYLSVAHTRYGERTLSTYLLNAAPLGELLERQGAVRELGSQLEERQLFETLGLRASGAPLPPLRKARRERALDPEGLLSWLETPDSEVFGAFRWLALGLPLVTFSLWALALAFDWSRLVWAVPLVAQIVISGRVHRAASQVFLAVTSIEGLFEQFAPLLKTLEEWKADSAWLDRVKARVGGGGERPSVAMQSFASRVAWFEARHNGLIYPFLNVLFLWDLNSVLALQRWKAQWGKCVRSWFEAIGELEAVSSLAGFSHDNPDYAWPEFVSAEAGPVFEAEALGHPLISAANRVGNDVLLGGATRALLVTGSNMSGKSTLLRAMGVAAVLALSGAPACARKLRLSSLFVCTSMRVSDSLDAGVSHFYAELGKLRRVILSARGGQRVFFLLDEILHGTNSRERQIGARWVLAEMLKEDAIGAVSTHDQGLCELPEPELSERVRQVHLREQVSGGEMTFDYQLREGPVSGGNALRLMRSLGLEVPLDET